MPEQNQSAGHAPASETPTTIHLAAHAFVDQCVGSPSWQKVREAFVAGAALRVPQSAAETPQSIRDVIGTMLRTYSVPFTDENSRTVAIDSWARELVAAETPRHAATWQDERTLAVIAKMIDENQRPPIEILKEMVRILRLKESAPASETGQASAWQTMESAPKDGTRILGGWLGYPLVQIVCCDADGMWIESAAQRTSPPPDRWCSLPLAPSEDETTRTER